MSGRRAGERPADTRTTGQRMLVVLAISLLVSPLTRAAVPPPPVGADSAGIPSWAQRAVWYEIVPERFRNGDPSNDPTAADIAGAWPHESTGPWHVSSWTGDWYRLQDWEKEGHKGFYFRAQQRRYGGDFAGIIDRLDYLTDLGVTAIYLTPVFDAPSLHKYDAATFVHIDHNFGPNPAHDRALTDGENPADPATWRWTSADSLFLRFLREAHGRGIRVIIDGVFDHVGTSFWAFRDVRKKGPASPYRDWFSVRAWDDTATARDEFDYDCWAGVKDLPQFKRDSGGLAPGPAAYIRAIVRRWMAPGGSPADGVDGWRLDAAELMPMPFWREFRTWVKSINPDAYITGEVWWEDWQNDRIFDPVPWLAGDAFDGVMNYRWAREACRFFIDGKQHIGAAEFDRRLRTQRMQLPSAVNLALMNLLDSHDTDRLASMIVNADERYDHRASPAESRDYRVRKPDSAEIRTQKLMVLFQMTYPGAPMIYYGDEAGMWGGDDPDERKPMLWDDLRYDDEGSHPFGQARPRDANVYNRDMYTWYRALIALRKASPSLSSGDFVTLLADDSTGVFAFIRSSAGERTIVVFNCAQRMQRATIAPESGAAAFRCVFGGGVVEAEGGMLHFRLPPRTGMIVRSVTG